MRGPRLVAAIACAAAGLAYPAASEAANPLAFASASGSCVASGESSWDTGPVATNHPDSLVRYVSDAPINFNGWSGIDMKGPDVIWDSAYGTGFPVHAGDSETGNAYCASQAAHYSVSYYDVPTTPATFAGKSTYGSNGSNLAFRAPGAGQYVADLTLSGGTVRVEASHSETFASSGTFQFDTIGRGDHGLFIQALEGPQAAWSLQIHALPVALSGVRWDVPAIEPGKIVHLHYTLSGDTDVTVQVADDRGHVVRTLATNLAAGRGDHTLTWDGRDQLGRLLPAGPYTATITTHDPSGDSQGDHTTLRLDNGPQTRFTHKPRMRSRRRTARFVFTSTDPQSTYQCKYARGWKRCTSPQVFHLRPGRYKFAVRAIDRYGIEDPTPARWSFRIRPRRR